jgi:drug/metabolite transporter (DMT)-like permease
MSRGLLLFLMILAMIAWGETWVSAKILNSYLPSLELVFWRFLFTALGLVPILFFIDLKVNLYDLKIVIISAFLLFLYNYFFFLGTKYGLASIGGVLVTTLNPIVTFFIIALLNKKSLNFIEICALFLGALGSFIILKIWNFDIKSLIKSGNLFYILASFTWPFLTIISAKNRLNIVLFSFLMYLFTSLIAFSVLKFKVHNILNFDFKFWVNLLLLSLFATSFATTIYFLGVKKLGSKVASAFFFLVPVTSIFFAVIFLKEKITLNLIIGGSLSIIAVYLINYSKAKNANI